LNARPRKLIAIAGTGTEVGKTWFAARLLCYAREQGWTVAARKPAQSFAADDIHCTDAEQLALASLEAPHTVCPPHRWYPLAMAPPMAADELAQPRITLTALLNEIRWPTPVDLGLVETAGGLHSPIAHDADNVDLLNALAPDHVALVADAGLGTINAVRLSLRALEGFNVVVFLNRFDVDDSLHALNLKWLREQYSVVAVTSIKTYWSALADID